MPKPLMRFKLFGQSAAQEKVGQPIVCTLYAKSKDIGYGKDNDIGLVLEHNNEMLSSSTIRNTCPIDLPINISRMYFPDGFRGTIELYNTEDKHFKNYHIDIGSSFTVEMAGDSDDISFIYDN